MKSTKKLSILLGAAMLCGAAVFSACKKDKDSEAVSLAKQTCDCAKQPDEASVSACWVKVAAKLVDYIDVTTWQFKDKNFEVEYADYIKKNCSEAADFFNDEE